MLNVTDIDHEPEMIEQARKNLIPSIDRLKLALEDALHFLRDRT